MRTQIIIFLLFVSSVFYGQDAIRKDFKKELKHQIGVAAGFTTGYGLSYRYWPNKWGIQATFSPYHSEDRTNISSGLTVFYSIEQTEKTSLFLYLGNHFLHNREMQYFGYYDDMMIYQSSESSVINDSWNMGFGAGIEMNLYKKLGFSIMVGYASFDTFEEIKVTGEVGLFYKLK